MFLSSNVEMYYRHMHVMYRGLSTSPAIKQDTSKVQYFTVDKPSLLFDCCLPMWEHMAKRIGQWTQDHSAGDV